MRNPVGKAVGGIAAVLGAAAVAFYLNEKASEKPAYSTEQEDGAISVRRYPALLVAETVQGGDRKPALNKGFDRLAAFIFAKDRPDGDRQRIAMTAPVLADRVGDGWRTRFVMPRRFTRETLPDPGADVASAELPARRVGAITFAGTASDATLREQEQRLRHWLRTRRYDPTGPAEYAFYNSPFIPGPLRRNEVLIPLFG